MKPNKISGLLGLAKRAGKLESGSFLTERAVKSGRARCVIVAEDASGNSKKNFINMCTYYKVPMYYLADKEELGHTIGCEDRVSLAITDAGFAKQISLLLENVISEEKMEDKTEYVSKDSKTE